MKKTLFQDKKEIYKRLVRLASELWGLKERNIDAHDPIIGLLFSAIAEELSKIGSEISDIRHGLVDEISTALLPRELNGAKPAHGILFLMPNESNSKVRKSFQFTSLTPPNQNSKTQSSEKTIYLSPVADFKVSQKFIQAIISPKGLSEWKDNGFEHNEYARVASKADSILIGVNVGDQIDFIDQLNLFFYNESFTDLLELQEEISLFQAKIGRHELAIAPKIPVASSNVNAIKSLITISQMQEQEVINLYRPFYYEINCNLNVRNWQEASNLMINQLFPQEAVELSLQNLLWIELTSSNPTSTKFLGQLKCQTNCIPILNRRFRELSYRVNNFFNIINLPGDDEFYDIEEIASINGQQYSAINHIQSDDRNKIGSYEVRHHRTGRIDEDEVVVKLNYLIELLRDESSAFNALDLNFLSVHLRTLSQNIEQLRNKIPPSQLHSSNNYLILQSQLESDTVFIKFWTTEGLAGNNLTGNSEILPLENYDIDPASIQLIVDMSLGRDRLTPAERLRMLQWQLTSRDGIYSKEDIRRFCLSRSTLIEDVSTQFVTMQMPDAEKGFQKFMSVEMKSTSASKLQDKDKERLRIEIQKAIESKSLISFPIIVRWKN